MGTVLALGAAVLLALAVGAALRSLVVVTRVESRSMAPTLPPGRHVLTRRPRGSRAVRRGDIVVIASQELGRPVVKRVVGLGGERVEVSADAVRVDGVVLAEPYVGARGGPAGVFEVPDGHLLLLGDNRAGSSDARSWRRPFLPVTAVRGRVVTRGRGGSAAAGPRPRSSDRPAA